MEIGNSPPRRLADFLFKRRQLISDVQLKKKAVTSYRTPKAR
jgi:hypothetical protein